MKYRLAMALLMLCLVPCGAQASNLNTTSNLLDEGIEPAPSPAKILGDVPLMPGLQLYQDPQLVKILPEFGDAPPVVTVGIVDVDDVYNFYKRELPPLGWKATSGRDYARGNLSLHINAHADGKMSRVTFAEDIAR